MTNKKLLKQIQKKYTNYKLTQTFNEWLNFPNYALNYICSGDFFKGIPKGIIIELYGEPSTGKSYLLNTILGMIQQAGGYSELDDVEKRYKKEFGAIAGIDNNELIYLRSKTIKEHFDTTKDTVRDIRKIDKTSWIGIALDSLAMLVDAHEEATRFDKEDMGKKAKNIKKGIRLNFVGEFADLGVVYIITNHVYSSMSMFGPAKNTSGGRGVPFEATIRLETNIKKHIRDERGNTKGVIFELVATKNSLTAPFKKCVIEVDYNRGIKKYSGLADILYRLHTLDKSRKKFNKADKKAGKYTGLYFYKDKKFSDDKIKYMIKKYPQLMVIPKPKRREK